MSDDTPRVSTEIQGHVFLIGLDRPEKLNAFDRQMLRELANAFTTYEDDPDLWCAVLFPTGEHFTSGLDLADVGPAVRTGEKLFPQDGVDPLGLFGRTRSKPLIHASRGWCLTIGTELALASDICIAGTGTQFGQIEVTRGIMAFGGATLRMHQTTGWGNAMRYLLTGDIFDADEAFRIGLVQEVVEPGAVVDRAIALAQTISEQAPLAVQATLRSAMTTRQFGHQAAASELMGATKALMESDDATEGVTSFVERRKAIFKGS